MIRTVVLASIVVCAAACLLYAARRRPDLPVAGPTMPGATVAAVAPAAAGAPRAVDASAEPSAAAARRRHNNSGANRFGPTHANLRPIRRFQTHL
nr:hypothetical protein [uncultured Actinoplanes sp.]